MEAFDNGSVSLGGLTVGLGIMAWHIAQWWWAKSSGKRFRDKFKSSWRPLVLPTVPLASYGMLLILSTGGVLGGAANFALWGSNHVGRVAIERGVGGDDVNTTRTTSLVLENPGHAVVLIMTVVVVAAIVFNKSARRSDLLLPVLAGICLGLSGGVAGWAAQGLGPAVDTLGGVVAGIL